MHVVRNLKLKGMRCSQTKYQFKKRQNYEKAPHHIWSLDHLLVLYLWMSSQKYLQNQRSRALNWIEEKDIFTGVWEGACQAKQVCQQEEPQMILVREAHFYLQH